MKRFNIDDKGSVKILNVIIIAVLISFVALFIEGKILFSRHSRLQNIAEASALAATHKLVEKENNEINAFNEVINYVEKNNLIPQNNSKTWNDTDKIGNIKVSNSAGEIGTLTVFFPAGKLETHVNITFKTKLYLGRALGKQSTYVTATAVKGVEDIAENN